MTLQEFAISLQELIADTNATPTEIDFELEKVQLMMMREHLNKVVE